MIIDYQFISILSLTVNCIEWTERLTSCEILCQYMCTDGGSLKHRSCAAGLRVTDPSDLYRRETSRRVDKRNCDQNTQHQYHVSN